jgi:hypothetical protein
VTRYCNGVAAVVTPLRRALHGELGRLRPSCHRDLGVPTPCRRGLEPHRPAGTSRGTGRRLSPRAPSPGGPEITSPAAHVAPVQRSLPPSMRSTVTVTLSPSRSSSSGSGCAGGGRLLPARSRGPEGMRLVNHPHRGREVPTPSSGGGLEKSCSRRSGVPDPLVGRGGGGLEIVLTKSGPGEHAPGARYFGRPKLRPEKSPRCRTTSRRWQRSLPPSMRSTVTVILSL